MKKLFDPTLYKTTCCNDVIFSLYPGNFKSCKCGKSFIDETSYYSRNAGRLEPLKKFSDYPATVYYKDDIENIATITLIENDMVVIESTKGLSRKGIFSKQEAIKRLAELDYQLIGCL